MACWCKGSCPLIRAPGQKIARRQFPQAEHDLKLILLDSPLCIEANLALAEIFTNTNRAADAMHHIARAEKTAGELTPAIALKRAHAQRNQTKLSPAIGSFRVAMRDNVTAQPVAAMLETMVAADAPEDEKTEVAAAALAQFPDSIEVRNAAAQAAAARKDFGEAVRLLMRPTVRPLDLLDRGRYQDRLGAHEAAWMDWQTARAKLRESAGLAFDRTGFDNMVGALKAMAQKRRLGPVNKAPALGVHSYQRPIFITGFPRSGTTVFETALASHPLIVAGDELPFIHEVMRLAPAVFNTDATYPSVLAASRYGDVAPGMTLLRDWYLHRALGRVPFETKLGAKFFTDKMCVNELHIPLILALFPSSPVFYMRRHPLDIVVSNFSYNFNIAWHCSATLWSIAYAYQQIDSVLQIYKKLFPGKIHEIRYEDFVRDIGGTMGAAQKIVDVPIDDACLNFHKSDRFARTASHRQVKEPLYDRSVGRWKAYEKFLEPVKAMLAPICEREGYEIQ